MPSPWRTDAAVARPPDGGERLDPVERVERVAEQEAPRRFHGPADAAVLVAPVLALLRRAREIEVEVGRASSRPGGAGEYDAQDVAVRRRVDEPVEVKELLGCLGRVPIPHVAPAPAG